jgi:hypothetical protein
MLKRFTCPLPSWFHIIIPFLLQDPREYLPFLRELRSLEKYYQRFRIDDHLKRYERALENLSRSGAFLFGQIIFKYVA